MNEKKKTSLAVWGIVIGVVIIAAAVIYFFAAGGNVGDDAMIHIPGGDINKAIAAEENAKTKSDATIEGGWYKVVDGVLYVTLSGNPTTGYQWTCEISDESLLTCKSFAYTMDETNGEIIDGAGGVYQGEFIGNAAGTAQIDFTYARSWEQSFGPNQSLGIELDKTGKVVNVSELEVPPYEETEESTDETTEPADEQDSEWYEIVDGMLYTVLEGNPTTGYQWTCEISDENVIICEGGDLTYLSDATDEEEAQMMAGVGGIYYGVFIGQQAGTAQIDFTYARSWETSALETRALTVEVGEDGVITGITELPGLVVDYEAE